MLSEDSDGDNEEKTIGVNDISSSSVGSTFHLEDVNVDDAEDDYMDDSDEVGLELNEKDEKNEVVPKSSKTAKNQGKKNEPTAQKEKLSVETVRKIKKAPAVHSTSFQRDQKEKLSVETVRKIKKAPAAHSTSSQRDQAGQVIASLQDDQSDESSSVSSSENEGDDEISDLSMDESDVVILSNEDEDIMPHSDDEQNNTNSSTNKSDDEYQALQELLEGDDTFVDGVFVGQVVKLDKHDLLGLVNNRAPSKQGNECALPDRGYKGSYLFVVDREKITHIGDLKLDNLSPWSKNEGGKAVAKPKSKPFSVSRADGNFVFVDKSTLKLRVWTAVCPENKSIVKKMAYVEDNKNKLYSNVVVLYTVAENGVTLPVRDTDRTKPSVMQETKAAFERRNIVQAAAVLKDREIFVKKSTLNYARRVVETATKLPMGPSVVTDWSAVSALLGKSRNVDKYEYTNAAGKPCYRVIVVFEDMVEAYLNGVCDESFLASHRDEVDALAKMSRTERKEHLETMLKTMSQSATLPGLGAHLLLDATFSLSDVLVTPVLGVMEKFETRRSGKLAPMPLAIMMHSEKIAENYEALGVAVGKTFDAVNSSKRVPAILVDGEVGLRKFKQGEVMSEAVVLGCDLHLRGNFERDGVVRGQDERAYQLLFGVTITRDGENVLKGGLLCSLTEDEFCRKIWTATSENLLSSDALDWVTERRRTLWAEHSLFSKLRGGISRQYNTTNTIEGYNAKLKLLIPSAIPGEKLLQILLDQNKEGLRLLYGTVTGSGTTDSLRVAESFRRESKSKHEWNGLDQKRKLKTLRKFGLASQLPTQTKLSFVPPAYLSSDKKCLPKLLTSMEGLEATRPKPGFFYVFPTKNPESVTVVNTLKDSLDCTRCRSTPFSLCVHKLCVYEFMGVEERTRVFNKLSHLWNNESLAQIVRRNAKKTDATKGGRKTNNKRSKNNKGRVTHVHSDLSCFADDLDPNEASILTDRQNLETETPPPKKSRRSTNPVKLSKRQGQSRHVGEQLKDLTTEEMTSTTTSAEHGEPDDPSMCSFGNDSLVEEEIVSKYSGEPLTFKYRGKRNIECRMDSSPRVPPSADNGMDYEENDENLSPTTTDKAQLSRSGRIVRRTVTYSPSR